MTGKNKWVLEQVGTQFHVKANFALSLSADLSPSIITAWATTSDPDLNLGSESSPVTLIYDSGQTWTGIFQVASANATARIDDQDITWTWHLMLSGSSNATIQEQSTHKLLTSFGNSDETDDGGHDDPEPLYSDESSGFPFAAALLEVPTTQAVEADLAKWASDVAKGLAGDETILDAMIKPENLAKIGSYKLPPTYPAGNPFGSDTRKEPLLAYKQGSCGHWSDFVAAAAKLENITITKNGFTTRNPSLNGTNWGPTDYAEGFVTKPLGPIGDQPRIYDFGDHQWVEYGIGRTIYDPSFATKVILADAPVGTTAPQLWKWYTLNMLMDRTKYWIRKPSSLPGNQWAGVPNADLTKAVLTPEAAGGIYCYFTYSDRWTHEVQNPRPQPDPNLDHEIMLVLADPPPGT